MLFSNFFLSFKKAIYRKKFKKQNEDYPATPYLNVKKNSSHIIKSDNKVLGDLNLIIQSKKKIQNRLCNTNEKKKDHNDEENLIPFVKKGE